MGFNQIFKYLPYIALLPLSYLFPKDNKLWVFGAWFGSIYADNSRYLFEYVQEDKSIKAVWITKKREVVSRIRADGNTAFMLYSPMGIFYMLRASLSIVSSGLGDLNGGLIYGSYKVNLWHGAPMKKIYYDDNSYKCEGIVKKYCRKFISAIIPYHRDNMILATSDYFRPIMAGAFRVSSNRVQVFGYPRNDVLFEKNHRCKHMEELKTRFSCRNILAYLPTYRNYKGGDDTFALFKKYGFEREAMETFLEETDSILLIKLHYVDQKSLKNGEISFGSRIVYASEKQLPDINDALGYIDVLITDYSGVYFDYLLLNRPVIFAAFDLEEYVRQIGLYNNYGFYVAGPIAKNWSEVIEYAKEAIWNPKKFEDLRIEKNKIFNKYHDGKNSMRLSEYLKTQIEPFQ